MKTLLVVSADEALRARLERTLSRITLFVAASDLEALKTLGLVDIDVVLRHSPTGGDDLDSFITRVKADAPQAAIIVACPVDCETDGADFVIPATFTEAELQLTLRYVTERQRLLRENAVLRGHSPIAETATAVGGGATPWEGATLARVLKEFTRVFAAGSDLPRVLDMFLDAIGELVRPARMGLMLPDDAGGYHIAAHRAVPPSIVRSVRLSASEGLARWLATQGRPARLQDLTEPEIARELRLVQGTLAVPLMAQGELVAMLIVGQPVVGGVYGRYETELLFDLSTHLATAIRDIGLHNQLRREKDFNEQILKHMSNGVITLGRDERIGTMNRRAAEILNLEAHATVGQDLRVLPSPLGDMLYGTLVSGTVTPRIEVRLALGGRSLEVSTYPVYGDEPAPIGSVLVFEDLTAQKELAAQTRQAEEMQLLARVVTRITDEIKNPLQSINTFTELLDERFEDPDFRTHFSVVVRRDMRRLLAVFEKLAGLVNERELHFARVDVRAVVDELVEGLERTDEGMGERMQIEITRESEPQMVKVDAAQLRKALSYLVWYLGHNSVEETARIGISIGHHHDREDATDSVRILVSSRTARIAANRLTRLFDPVQMMQESFIDVGPAVSQRLIEALGGRLRYREGRHEFSFLVTLPLDS
jgi:two-component system, NtrC family, sensor histidine kinase AtoS